MAQTMVTTVDNPWNPFTRFDEWYAYDVHNGYHTSAYLARVARSSDELSFTDQELAIEEAVDEIVFENILGLYIKLTPELARERFVDQV